MLDLRQTKEYAHYLKRDGWIIEKGEETNYFIHKFPVIGCILKLQRPNKVDLNVIHNLCLKYHIFQVIIEPRDSSDVVSITNNGYKLAKNTYLPSKSLQIDLTQSQKVIYASFQRNIKTGIKRGETIETKEYSTPNEIKIFRNAWKKSVNYKRYVPSLESLLNLRKSFPGNKSVFLASHNIVGTIIGGVIFTISSHGGSNYITYYMYGFTSNEGRSTLTHAALLYQGILWGRKIGCKIFDFEGIYDPRFPNKSWLGFTRFKKSFGGYEILYPGAYVKNTLFRK